MNSLSLDENMRRRFLSVGALSTDCDGDETLVGLIVAESNFILELPNMHSTALGRAEIQPFLYLYKLHSVAFAKKCEWSI